MYVFLFTQYCVLFKPNHLESYESNKQSTKKVVFSYLLVYYTVYCLNITRMIIDTYSANQISLLISQYFVRKIKLD